MKSLSDNTAVVQSTSGNPIVSVLKVFFDLFLGKAPSWYKLLIVVFLFANFILLNTVGPFITGWVILIEFIFTLVMAMSCYPLSAGGILAIQTIVMGMTTPESVYHEVVVNYPILLLLMFMVAGIFFMKPLLKFVFSNVLVSIRSKTALSMLFCILGIVLSAFLDALTVVAIVITVGKGFYDIYHDFASERGQEEAHEKNINAHIKEEHREDLMQFRAFLTSLLMHAAVGTALGGVCTLVGEPQNLIIGNIMGWHFVEFAVRMSPVTMPVLFVGLATCFALEKFRLFNYGHQLPQTVYEVIYDSVQQQNNERDLKATTSLIIQAFVAIWLVIALALHLAEVGLIGLSVMVLLTTLTGVTDEHHIGEAFTESLPFAGLLVVFFAIVAVIHDNHLFAPIINLVLQFTGNSQLVAFFMASGVLSAISDNVFVATIYISEAKKAFDQGLITREQFELIAVAINAGTNILSVATPNGQAAFLFLLTSKVASDILLSYWKMAYMALPYTITMAGTAFIAVWFFL